MRYSGGRAIGFWCEAADERTTLLHNASHLYAAAGLCHARNYALWEALFYGLGLKMYGSPWRARRVGATQGSAVSRSFATAAYGGAWV